MANRTKLLFCLPLCTALLAIALPAVAAASQTAPSFDCRKASRGAEKAICNDARLAQLDRRIATRFGALIKQFDPAGAKALRQDQRWFVTARDYAFDDGLSGTQAERLRDLWTRLDYRVKFLDAVIPRPTAGVAGNWGNLFGEVKLTGDGPARLTASLNTAEPGRGRWLCQASGPYRGSAIRGEVNDPDDPDQIMILARVGSTLEVTERSRNGKDHGSPFCGMNGTVAGSYFRLTGPTESE